MATAPTIIARARTDAQDRLVDAEEPLASFHLRSGGELPGALVTPALLELVRKARIYGLRLARLIKAQDGSEQVSAWVEVEPEGEGVTIGIANWHADALPSVHQETASAGKLALLRHIAGMTAHLGPSQEILAVDCETQDLEDLAEKMRGGIGQVWTEFVAPAAQKQHQPLHWRLLDGATVDIPGSERSWTVHLNPLGTPQPGSDGFELYLVSREAPPETATRSKHGPNRIGGIGREIAPVLRQPVSRIIANAETIRTQLAGPLAEEYSAYAADIATAGEHLLALIEDLTTLELVEDEAFVTAPDKIDLADVARRAVGILGVRASERRIALDAPKAGDSVPAVGEFRRVLQILLNLVGNAIRYSPEGGQVWIRTEHDAERARITVADQGEGLDEDEQQRVFSKFERLGRSGDGGSGLGLYISRRLAEAMGGTLGVESAKGQGARFTLELPTFEERRQTPRD
ncbi:sensor histidine kinase [Aurantiacibacter gangjinensis]|uniref:histidine kinase n=1 Tax=Aurantiacibacter gangjinensis TaxID=502682 RepID=A0A0G9MQH4_9SPHN|nr:HAMP domain-containing sensor histidine kinase [Aurantiacibacter gangjinensis]APE28816.1 Two-component signal transduction histidine kinase [Aurantiacibacter gangjinensis]KLE32965.1 histidine kinase [Aurantiacibacter gangjinensis]